MNRLIEWFTRNGVAANILMISIIGAGIYAGFYKIVLQQFPDYPSRTIEVSVSYRGSTPTEVEEAIVIKIEEALYNLEGLKEMESRASSNSGVVSLVIEDNYDIGKALDEIKNRVDGIRTLPDETEQPRVRLRDRSEEVITVVLSGDLSEFDMKRMGASMRDGISALDGVSLVELDGVRDYEIAIEIPEARLKEYGITFDEVVRAIRANSIDLSAGTIRSDGGNILLRTSEQAYSGDEYSSIVVVTRPDGSQLTVGDLAEVNDGFDETPIVARFNGKRSVFIDVSRTGAQNIIELAGQVKRYVASTQKYLPEGLNVTYSRDRSERIAQRLATLRGSAITGFALVLIVLSLFLRPSLAIWVAMGIPIAFAGGMWTLSMLGVSLNLITLFSFILVLGIVVDDAIVSGENVFQHMQNGEDPVTASIKGTQEVAVPVIFGVLTTAAAFYPLTIMTGTRGNFFKMIPLVIIPVLFFSLLESKLILPAHLKHCKRLGRKQTKRTPLIKAQRFFAEGLERVVDRYYRPVLDVCLRYRYITMAVFVAILILFIGLLVGGRFKFRFFPSIPQDSVRIELAMPIGTSFETTSGYIDHIEKVALDLKKEKNEEFGTEVISNIYAIAGSGGQERGRVYISLVPTISSGVDFTSRMLGMEMRKRVGPIPEAESFSFSINRSSGGLTVQLMGPDIDKLKEVSKTLQSKLRTYEGLYDIEDSFERASDEFELELKPQASHLGVTAQNLARQVRQAFFGAEAQRIQRGRDDVRVMVRYPEEERKSLASLYTMMIRTQDGTEVPFEEVAEIVPGKSLPSIRRINRNRIIRVTADGDQETVDVDAIQSDILDNYLPDLLRNYSNISVSLEGRAAESRDNSKELKGGIVFVLLVLYVLLAIPLRSYSQPLIVMSVIPFGIVGAILGHRIMSLTSHVLGRIDPADSLTMLSLFGMLALAGVVVNDSLVLVHYINKKLSEGMELNEAVRIAGVKRFRPILLTSLTTFAGLFPLMFEQSRQAMFLIPMAISLAWGVMFATFITLILVPAIQLVFEDIRIGFCRLYNLQEFSKTENRGGSGH